MSQIPDDPRTQKFGIVLVELAVEGSFEVRPLAAGGCEGGEGRDGRGAGGEACVGVDGAELVLELAERQFFLGGAVLEVLVKYHELIIMRFGFLFRT